MLNLLSSSALEWVGDWRYWLVLGGAIAVAFALLIVTIVKKSGGRSLYKQWTISSGILAGTIGVVVIIYSIILEVNKGSFSASYSSYLIAAVVILLLGTTLLTCLIDRKKKQTNNSVALVYAAVCIAMSFALSYVKFMKMPQGGSITLASLLPIAIYSYIFGARRGIVCCFVYGILQMIQDPYFAHPIQVLLDYPLAFILIGLSGVFKRPLAKAPYLAIFLGILIGITGRYLAHVVSGSVFFAEFAPEGINPWIYSLGYNTYVFIDGAISMALGAVLLTSKQMLRETVRIQNKYQLGSVQSQPPIENNSEEH